MALPTVMKHLGVLEESGIVLSVKTGRVRTYSLQRESFADVERWLAERRSNWNGTFDRLDRFLAEEQSK